MLLLFPTRFENATKSEYVGSTIPNQNNVQQDDESISRINTVLAIYLIATNIICQIGYN
jgi:hypothetical protein